MNSSLALRDLSSVGSNLISLDISSCGISSSVLNSLHNLTSVRSLDLSYNQLTKKIPKSLGYNLCNLRDLDLSFNDFFNVSLTSLLESIFKCKSPHLESLILWSSGLSGTIPDSIGRLSFLRSLDLGGNQIFGSITSSIGLLSLLNELNLSDNQLNGNLPDSIGRLSSLKVLDLSFNSISGRIPDSLEMLPSLEKLDLSYNRLNGSIPYPLGRLSSLKELRLSDNQLNGSLPNSLGQLSNLEIFSFSSNLLTGVVTEAHFSKLVNLKELYGGRNKLTLRPRLANWIPPFQSLQRLYLSSWDLGSQFPSWLQSQMNLDLLDISNTEISSPMPPESFWRSLPNLRYLNISRNHIKGTLKLLDIPATIDVLDLSSNELTGELSPISKILFSDFLDLSNNSFTGSLHDFLCSNSVKQTRYLYLGNNHLSGFIPECWDKWPRLQFLELENNNFIGGIPTTMGFLSQLRLLNMRGNKLSGRLPTCLMNLTNLVILQLGRNVLVGSIPLWFGKELSHLRILNLRSNRFDGIIPSELCYLKHIQILDLAHNNMSGNIPICFNNFSVFTGNETISKNHIYNIKMISGMSTKYVTGSDSLVMKGREDTYSSFLGLVTLLDLSCNNLVGPIPGEITFLKALQTLNLSINQLTGRIPEKIGGMKALTSFDLSVNMLSGELPVSLSSLSFLSSVNVSHNNLTGREPSSTQLQTLNESSFFGNKLCGPPLTESCAIEMEVPDRKDQKDDDGADLVLIVSIVFGFVCGFWIILAPLIVSRSWRIAYFGLLSKLRYMVYA